MSGDAGCWLVGVLCENCIVDAGITQQTVGLHFCVVGLLCCVISFVLLCFVVHAGNSWFPAFCGGGWLLLVVCSLLRAHGGCLGMLSR